MTEDNVENKQPEIEHTETPKSKKPKKPRKVLAGSAIALIILSVVVVLVAAGFSLDHLSRTSPQFCATCHNMTDHVDSYLSSNHMDYVHNLAGVGCKECHSDYTIPAEIGSAVKFVTGNYEVPFKKIKVSNAMCLQCHIDIEFQALKTADLTRNPHDNHTGESKCTNCHTSHGDQIDYCSQCHDNGGQEMIEEKVATFKGEPTK